MTVLIAAGKSNPIIGTGVADTPAFKQCLKLVLMHDDIAVCFLKM